MGISKNIGVNTPKWMVKIMENPIKMDDLGGTTIFGKHPYSERIDGDRHSQKVDLVFGAMIHQDYSGSCAIYFAGVIALLINLMLTCL